MRGPSSKQTNEPIVKGDTGKISDPHTKEESKAANGRHAYKSKIVGITMWPNFGNFITS